MLLALFLGGACARADDLALNDWTPIAEDKQFIAYMSSKFSTQAAYKRVAAWELRTQHQRTDKAYTKVLYLYDCAKFQRGLKAVIVYDASGVLDKFVSIPDYQVNMIPMVARSMDEVKLRYACSLFGW